MCEAEEQETRIWQKGVVVELHFETLKYGILFQNNGVKQVCGADQIRRVPTLHQTPRSARRYFEDLGSRRRSPLHLTPRSGRLSRSSQHSDSYRELEAVLFAQESFEHQITVPAEADLAELREIFAETLMVAVGDDDALLLFLRRSSGDFVQLSEFYMATHPHLLERSRPLEFRVLTPEAHAAEKAFEGVSGLHVGGISQDVIRAMPAWPGRLLEGTFFGLEEKESLIGPVARRDREIQLRVNVGRFGLKHRRPDGHRHMLGVLLDQLVKLNLFAGTQEELHRLLRDWLSDHLEDERFGLSEFLGRNGVEGMILPKDPASDWFGDEPLIFAFLQVFRVSVLLIGSLAQRDWFRQLFPLGMGPGDGLPQCFIGFVMAFEYWSLEHHGFICFSNGEKKKHGDEQAGFLSIQYWDHASPQANTTYFSQSKGSADEHRLVIGIAMYNEGPNELKRTLTSLAEQQVDLEKSGIFSQALLVMDGFEQMDAATAIYLESIFCGSDKTLRGHWREMTTFLEDHGARVREVEAKAGAGDVTARQSLTFVIENVFPATTAVESDPSRRSSPRHAGVVVDPESDGEEDEGVKKTIRLSLIIKSDNRRKHNSGTWVMCPQSGFARSSAADFLLMTDCGTIFEKKCLDQLVRFMLRHPMAVGVTARTRILWAHEQGTSKYFLEGLSMRSIYRLVQMADYEVIHMLQVGCYSLVGMLPVLPGPCALYSYRALITPGRIVQERTHLDQYLESYVERDGMGRVSDDFRSPYSHFEKVITHDIAEATVLRENLKIAEDRIPSYAVVSHGRPAMGALSRGPYTTWVTGVSSFGPVFKVEAETEIRCVVLFYLFFFFLLIFYLFRSFIAQRRRWINGALCSFIWLCFSYPNLILGAPSMSITRRATIYLLYLLQILNYVFACLFTSIFGSAIFLSVIQLGGTVTTGIIVSSVYAGVALLFGIVHHWKPLIKSFFYVLAVMNACGMVVVLVAMFQAAAIAFQGEAALTIWTGFFVLLFLPFLMMLISLDFHSFGLLLLSFIPYLLFLPSLVGTFTLYSMARIGDTSWGNRASSDRWLFKNNVSPNQLKGVLNRLGSDAQVVLVFLVLINAGLLVAFYFLYTVWAFLLTVVIILLIPTAVQFSFSVVWFLWNYFRIVTGRLSDFCFKEKSNDETGLWLRQNTVGNMDHQIELRDF
jgi:hypothetical protein